MGLVSLKEGILWRCRLCRSYAIHFNFFQLWLIRLTPKESCTLSRLSNILKSTIKTKAWFGCLLLSKWDGRCLVCLWWASKKQRVLMRLIEKTWAPSSLLQCFIKAKFGRFNYWRFWGGFQGAIETKRRTLVLLWAPTVGFGIWKRIW